MKPERVVEHEGLVRAVFAELADIGAFKAFTAQIRGRVDEPPVTVELAAVGAFGL